MFVVDDDDVDVVWWPLSNDRSRKRLSDRNREPATGGLLLVRVKSRSMLFRVIDDVTEVVLIADGVVDVYRVLLTPNRPDDVGVSSPLMLRYDPIKLDRRNRSVPLMLRLLELLLLRLLPIELLPMLEKCADFRYDVSAVVDGKYVLLGGYCRVEIAGILQFFSTFNETSFLLLLSVPNCSSARVCVQVFGVSVYLVIIVVVPCDNFCFNLLFFLLNIL